MQTKILPPQWLSPPNNDDLNQALILKFLASFEEKIDHLQQQQQQRDISNNNILAKVDYIQQQQQNINNSLEEIQNIQMKHPTTPTPELEPPDPNTKFFTPCI